MPDWNGSNLCCGRETRADYIVIAADVAIDEASRFGNKKLYVTSLEDAIVHPEQILESLTTKSYSYQDATVSNKKILG